MGATTVIREAIAATKGRIAENNLPLDELGPIVRAVRAEMRLDVPDGARQKQVIDDWMAARQRTDAILQMGVLGVTIALGIAAIITGGAAAVILGLAGSAVGLGAATYNVYVANKLDDVAFSSLMGEELVDDPEEVRAAYYLAVADLLFGGLDLAFALKQAPKPIEPEHWFRRKLNGQSDEAEQALRARPGRSPTAGTRLR